jgi:hypothetical protein
METIDLVAETTVEITVEEFLRLKEEGKLKANSIEGIVPPQFGKTGSFGTIRIKRETPLYRPL